MPAGVFIPDDIIPPVDIIIPGIIPGVIIPPLTMLIGVIPGIVELFPMVLPGGTIIPGGKLPAPPAKPPPSIC